METDMKCYRKTKVIKTYSLIVFTSEAIGKVNKKQRSSHAMLDPFGKFLTNSDNLVSLGQLGTLIFVVEKKGIFGIIWVHLRLFVPI